MHLRPLALAATLLLGAGSASAQFVELVSEAPVTLSAVIQTSTITQTETSRSSTVATTRLSQAQILEELRAAGTIDTETISGWSLVAVRAPAADLRQLNAAFQLWAVNRTLDRRVEVPSDKFFSGAVPYALASRYSERHLGQYVISSSGTVTSHVVYQYRPTFSAGGSTFQVEPFDSLDSLPQISDEFAMPEAFSGTSNFGASGFARINYVARDLSDGHEIFTFAITSISANAIGGFSASVTGDASARGVMNILVNVGAAKLVPAELYPGVSTNPFASDF